MKISEHFSNYGLIGGLFWLLQFAFYFASYSHPTDQLRLVAADFATFPMATSPLILALLGTIGLIVAFTSGLLLDLLGSSSFRATEMTIFAKLIRHHLSWFQEFAELNSLYIKEDLGSIGAGMLKGYASTLTESTPNKHRQEALRPKRNVRCAKDAYTRMQALLLSYALITAGGGEFEIVNTQMSLWISARAIGAVFGICGIEAGVIYIAELIRSKLDRMQSPLGWPSLWLVAVELTLMIVGFWMASGAYRRALNTLFACTYILDKRQNKDR